MPTQVLVCKLLIEKGLGLFCLYDGHLKWGMRGAGNRSETQRHCAMRRMMVDFHVEGNPGKTNLWRTIFN